LRPNRVATDINATADLDRPYAQSPNRTSDGEASSSDVEKGCRVQNSSKQN